MTRRGNLEPGHAGLRETTSIKLRFISALNRDPDVPPSAKCVAFALLDFHNTTTGQCNPSAEALAKAAGTSRRSVLRALEVLRKSGWIYQRRGRGTPSYSFPFDRAANGTSGVAQESNGPCEEVPDLAHQETVEAQQEVPDVAPQRAPKVAPQRRKRCQIRSEEVPDLAPKPIREPITPLTPQAHKTTAGSAATKQFVARNDPRWQRLCERFRREINPCGPNAVTSQGNGNAVGWWFSRDWIADMQREQFTAVNGGKGRDPSFFDDDGGFDEARSDRPIAAAGGKRR